MGTIQPPMLACQPKRRRRAWRMATSRKRVPAVRLKVRWVIGVIITPESGA